jgi:hypothetical protein
LLFTDDAAAKVNVIVLADGVEVIIQHIPGPCWSSMSNVASTTDVAVTPGTVTAAVAEAAAGQLKIPEAVTGFHNELLGQTND